MPTYDFRCGGCRKKYTLTMSITERDRKRIKVRGVDARGMVHYLCKFQ